MRITYMYAVFDTVIGPYVYAATLKDSYAHIATLDDKGKYVMYWTMDDKLKVMHVAITVQTTGWIGFGISPYTGRMPGSDTVIGWVDNQGKTYLQDRYATGHVVPTLDTQQDYTLISGEEANGMTILKFKRKYNTSDSRDLPLEGGTTRLIWSYHSSDPSSPEVYTKHEYQGTRSLNLFNTLPEKDKPPMPNDTKTFDVLAKNVTIPAAATTYWCTALKLPEVNGTAHVIRLTPKIQKGNEGLVHHILIYDCTFEEHLHGTSEDCDSANMPEGLGDCRGATLLAAWAVGGEDTSLPAHVGLPLGGLYGTKYVLMETHYDNPNLLSGVVDASGMTFYYTHQKRQYDAGILEVGRSVGPFQMIPEGLKTWQTIGYCSEDCTRRNLPAAGINVLGGMLHTHLAGRTLTVKHYRDGKELANLAHNPHYDFNYQDLMFYKQEIKIMPGDQLTTICGYNTEGRKKVTVGGIGTKDEMCLGFFLYYPKQEMSVCLSYENYLHMVPYINALRAAGQTAPYNDYPSKPPYLWNILNNMTIGHGKLLHTFHDLMKNIQPYQYCAARDHKLMQESISNFK
ncbi:uncharacterized protein TRIADDRAFT_55464 [Trichoplax adhaerens]|uniref:DOMON domain-containing protein n=1 Tax=Trichoplax adhaerens TaxID=10228 RepID=B3RUZ1_TRIAD|nr:hypothetical protein TRIADDRAFT_55464 [Trichoplax adhaerens]EDV25403.1 hypothetical protein TRIADDRAFT_55464 [Trichoplax adhaerens]|eukprot:XP_002111436.1 hypothetical protein TRIADDRAFT_55464 [Trichoplax adhaerens]